MRTGLWAENGFNLTVRKNSPRLSCGRMIRLLARPLLPHLTLPSTICFSFSVFQCVTAVVLADGKGVGGGGVGEELNHTTARKPGPL
jgi:hypothetical protein